MKIIIVANKTDLGLRQEVIKKWLKLKLPTVYISAKTGAGISDLKRNIINLVAHGFEKYDDQIIITSKRHRDCLRNTRQFIVNAQKTIDANLGNEFVSVELREALHTLGQITGETANDDILNQIFKNFCIGK